MRKKSSSKTKKDFTFQVDQLLALLARATAATTSQSHPLQDASMLATMVFHQVYVAFERALSELIVGYINQAPQHYQGFIERRIRQSVEDKHGAWIAKRVTLGFPKHMSVSEVQASIDPDSLNLSFSSADKMVAFASDALDKGSASHFSSLSLDDRELLDSARLIRHHISHRSEWSRAEMNAALSRLRGTGANAGLERAGNEVKTVGAYLRAQHPHGTRAHAIAKRLEQIIASL